MKKIYIFAAAAISSILAFSGCQTNDKPQVSFCVERGICSPDSECARNVCTCDPCRMRLEHVKCFHACKDVEIAKEKEKAKQEAINNYNEKNLSEADSNKNSCDTLVEAPVEAPAETQATTPVEETAQISENNNSDNEHSDKSIMPDFDFPFDREFVLLNETFVYNDKFEKKPEKAITISFFAKSGIMAAGCSGVNQYNAQVILDEKNKFLFLKPVSTTRMMGLAMDYEHAFLEALKEVKSYIYNGHLWLISAENGVIASFEPMATAPKRSYKVTKDLTYILERDSIANVTKKERDELSKDVTISFVNNDGTLQIAGCAGLNLYFAKVENINEETGFIKLNNFGSTMMAGPGMDFESKFLKAIEKTVSYYFEANKLVLLNKDNNIIATFYVPVN